MFYAPTPFYKRFQSNLLNLQMNLEKKIENEKIFLIENHFQKKSWNFFFRFHFFLLKNRFFQVQNSIFLLIFCRFCLGNAQFGTAEWSESSRNRFKMILLDLEMRFKKNLIKKYFLIMEKNNFEKNPETKNENFRFSKKSKFLRFFYLKKQNFCK